MKLSEAFPSNFLKSDDLQGRDVTVVIAGAEFELVGKDQKLVLSFQGKKKSMICNKTNANRIAFIYGDETEDWIGKEIILTAEFVEFQGKTVKGLRVKAPQQKPQREFVAQDRGSYTMTSTRAKPDGLQEAIDAADDFR